jgi:hypothetical protein
MVFNFSRTVRPSVPYALSPVVWLLVDSPRLQVCPGWRPKRRYIALWLLAELETVEHFVCLLLQVSLLVPKDEPQYGAAGAVRAGQVSKAADVVDVGYDFDEAGSDQFFEKGDLVEDSLKVKRMEGYRFSLGREIGHWLLALCTGEGRDLVAVDD